MCVGLFLHRGQIGFARAITDYATFAYVADVFVLEAYRGHGLSKILLSALMAQLENLNLRRILLVTSTAHHLYSQFGFATVAQPEHVMEKFNPNVYRQV